MITCYLSASAFFSPLQRALRFTYPARELSSGHAHSGSRLFLHNTAYQKPNISVQMTAGKFIVFEGADRSGKTTQTKLCVDSLRQSGINVAENCPWRFPDRTTKVGKLIDAYLKDTTDLDDHVLHLLFSANRWEKAELIREAIKNGQTVVLDRYAFSGVAYSTAKGLDFDWCKAPDMGLPAPDLVLYLDLPFEVAAKRGEFGAERYERESMQRAVAKQFTNLQDHTWTIIDANASQEVVFERIMTVVLDAMAKNNASNKLLWTK